MKLSAQMLLNYSSKMFENQHSIPWANLHVISLLLTTNNIFFSFTHLFWFWIALPIIAISFCNISWLVLSAEASSGLLHSTMAPCLGFQNIIVKHLNADHLYWKLFLTLLLRGNFILQCYWRISPAYCKVQRRLMIFTLASRLFSAWMILRMRAYSARTPNTWMMQDTTQVSTAVSPSALGALAVTELKMLTRTRNKVTRRAMRPDKNSIIIVCTSLVNWLQWHDVVMY